MTQQADHIGDDLLSALVDDQLTQAEQTAVQAHLRTCSACQERLDELRLVAGLLRRLPELEPPRDFRLGPRLVADPPNVIRLRRWYTVARASAASLAAVFVFLSVGAFYVDSRPASAPAAQLSQTRTDAVPAAAPQAAPAPPQAVSAVKSAVPAAASQAAPGAAAAARAAPSLEAYDQTAAVTGVSPLPTLVPTPQLTAVAPPVPATLASNPTDSAAPLRYAAVTIGVLAVLTLLTAVLVRHRLRRVAAHSFLDL